MTRAQLAMCPLAATPRWKPGNTACQFYCAHQVTAMGSEVNTGFVRWSSGLNFGMSKQRCSSFAGSACVIATLHRYQPAVCSVQCGGRVRTSFFDEASDHCLLDVAARDAQVGAQTMMVTNAVADVLTTRHILARACFWRPHFDTLHNTQ